MEEVVGGVLTPVLGRSLMITWCSVCSTDMACSILKSISSEPIGDEENKSGSSDGKVTQSDTYKAYALVISVLGAACAFGAYVGNSFYNLIYRTVKAELESCGCK